ncbi:MAG: hypothetical protein D6758_01470 [Gammaproteobacteria bacterium]|nr:MAG: hypothetical protein D6758_01470 [Gammaproteobacteria bacterium]
MADQPRLRKPDTRTALAELLSQMRATFPLDAPDSRLCNLDCNGCSKKLLEFLEMQIEDWERRLGEGETPTFGDLEKLGRMARKIHRALVRNGVLSPDRNPEARS